jgi:hypothetical protein
MSKDLTRRTNVTKSEQTKIERTLCKTEVERAQEALAERMLFGAETRPQDIGGPSRIILGLDCTMSMGEFVEARNISPETASIISNRLFAEAGPAGLAIQFVFFRGDDQLPKQPRQLRVSSKWYTTPEELARAIAAIEHWPGWTQHCRLLRHAIAEAEKQAVQQVVIISDAFERVTPRRRDSDDLPAAQVHAARLRDLGVKLVIGYKGTIRGACPLDRAGVDAEQAFRDIARVNDGYCFPLDLARDPAQVGERFGEIIALARMSAQGDAAGVQRLLEHVQTIPFKMTVDERLPSARCTPQPEGSEE